MGAKTALLAFSDGDLRAALLGATRCDPAEAEDLVRQVLPGYAVRRTGDGNLSEYAYPGDFVTYATVLAGAEIVSDRRLVSGLPSGLPAHLIEAAAGRRILLHAMHSVSDSLAFAVWEDGVLRRSLVLSPDDGIVENIGRPYEFEAGYWAGAHPAGGAYPLPFHPLDLGEEALRAHFGFIIEGKPAADDIDAFGVHMHEFVVEDATGRERVERDAAVAQWIASARLERYEWGDRPAG